MDLSNLAEFLRTRRDRVRPEQVGLPVGPRRRVPGLRRDEVAHLAGASTDYYIQLERGGAQPSEQMTAALARALRLSSDERDHLFRLAGRPVPQPFSTSAHVHPGLLDLLDHVGDTPARVISDVGAVLAQNAMGRALLGQPEEATGLRRSGIYRWFTEPQVRDIYPAEDHDHHSRQYVADLRAVTGRRGKDPDIKEIVENLLRYSPEFAELWERHDVGVRRGERKKIAHPELGIMELNCLSMVSEDGRQKLLWFSAPPGTQAVDQLAMLATIGTQALSPSDEPASETAAR